MFIADNDYMNLQSGSADSNRVTAGVVAGKEKEHPVITRVPKWIDLL